MNNPISYSNFMSGTDALMHAFETDPSMRTAGMGVFMLERPPDRKELTRRLERLTRLVPRFRQKATEVPFGISQPRFVVDPNFDLDYHIRWLALPAEAGIRDLFDYVQVQQVQDLDKHRAPWEVTVISGLPDGKAALLFKSSHTVTDAVGGIAMLAPLFDDADSDSNGADVDVPTPEDLSARDLIVEGAGNEVRFAAQSARSVGSKSLALVRDPLGSVKGATRAIRSLAKVMGATGAQRSSIMCGRSLSVRCDRVVLPLDPMKKAATAGGGKLNDAFVAGAAGAMRLYHQLHHATLDDLTMIMPMNVRDARTEHEAGNRWVVAKLAVPVAEPDPAKRIALIRERSLAARAEPGLLLFTNLSDIMTRIPTPLLLPLYKAGMMSGLDLGTSNVPGPPVVLKICGQSVEQLFLYGPIGAVPANLTMVSYHEHLDIAVQTNNGAIPDGEAFMQCLRAGFDEVLALSA